METRMDVDEAQRLGDTPGIDRDSVDLGHLSVGPDVECTRETGDSPGGGLPEREAAAGGIVMSDFAGRPDYDTQLAATICAPMRSFHTFRQLLL